MDSSSPPTQKRKLEEGESSPPASSKRAKINMSLEEFSKSKLLLTNDPIEEYFKKDGKWVWENYKEH